MTGNEFHTSTSRTIWSNSSVSGVAGSMANRYRLSGDSTNLPSNLFLILSFFMLELVHEQETRSWSFRFFRIWPYHHLLIVLGTVFPLFQFIFMLFREMKISSLEHSLVASWFQYWLQWDGMMADSLFIWIVKIFLPSKKRERNEEKWIF